MLVGALDRSYMFWNGWGGRTSLLLLFAIMLKIGGLGFRNLGTRNFPPADFLSGLAAAWGPGYRGVGYPVALERDQSLE